MILKSFIFYSRCFESKYQQECSYNYAICLKDDNYTIGYVEKDSIPYITATHDVNNTRSGEVMRKLGMKCQYSYEEQWQPKDFLVTFRMYQLNLDGKNIIPFNVHKAGQKVDVSIMPDRVFCRMEHPGRLF